MDKLCKEKKGQALIIDFIISISIFLLLIVIAYSAWVRNTDRIGEELEKSRGEEAARRLLDVITESPGEPPSWNIYPTFPSNASIKALGCAVSPGVIDPQKLIDYEIVYIAEHNATVLKSGYAPYEAAITVSYLNGTSIKTMPPLNPADTYVASAQRIAAYNGQPVLVSVQLERLS